MSQNSVNQLTETALKNLRSLVDTSTIVGEPITTVPGIVIIPISKVAFGFAGAGSDIPTTKPGEPFGGGSGSGVSIKPIAFLVIKDNDVKLLQIQTADSTADRMVNAIPEVIDKVTALFKKDSKKNPEEAGASGK